MDLTIFWFSIVVLGFISSIFLFHSHKSKSNDIIKLPPGSSGLPIIGESLKFMSDGQKGKPENFAKERMAKYSPDVFKTSIAGGNMAVFCGSGGNKLVFSNESNKIDSWWPAPVKKILTSKGSSVDANKRVRILMSQFLRPEALKEYVPIMDCMITNYMIKEWATNEIIHASSSLKNIAFSLSCRLFMNIEEPDQVAQIQTHFDHILPGTLSVPIDFPGTAYNRAIKGANYIRDKLLSIIKQRRSQLLDDHSTNNYTDLLTYLVESTRVDQNDKIIPNEIADSVLSLLLASHDTTSSVMAMVVHFLADHPHVYEKVLKEQMEIKKFKEAGESINWNDTRKMKYSRNVMNEVMRLAPSAVGGFRQATSDITYAGFTIPKGWKIFWTVHTTNKNPKYFENPEVFDPSRFEGNGPAPYSFVPFGQGPHMCPGHEFARLEILVFMHNLVTRFRWEKLVQREKIVYNPVATLASGLPIRLLPLLRSTAS